MSNTIHLKRVSDIDLRMSNGLTHIFINTFAVAGSKLAKTEQEKKLVVFILEKNQYFVGMGNVGFDIGEMPWSLENFENEKAFVLSVLNGIRNKDGWETLGYPPREDWIFQCVDIFKQLIHNMTEDDIDFDEVKQWHEYADKESEDPVNQGFPLCPVHNVLLTIFGCQVCTD